MKLVAYTFAASLLAAPVFAQEGDAAAGEMVFNQCQACHVVVNDEGETLAGRAGRTGPNLYGVVGRTAGTIEDFRYSDAMSEAGEEGLQWELANFVPYVQDPSGFLSEFLGDRARGKMSFRLRSEEDAQNVFAYLKSLGPDEEASEDSGS